MNGVPDTLDPFDIGGPWGGRQPPRTPRGTPVGWCARGRLWYRDDPSRPKIVEDWSEAADRRRTGPAPSVRP